LMDIKLSKGKLRPLIKAPLNKIPGKIAAANNFKGERGPITE
jgi:hypothetical protein